MEKVVAEGAGGGDENDVRFLISKMFWFDLYFSLDLISYSCLLGLQAIETNYSYKSTSYFSPAWKNEINDQTFCW